MKQFKLLAAVAETAEVDMQERDAALLHILSDGSIRKVFDAHRAAGGTRFAVIGIKNQRVSAER